MCLWTLLAGLIIFIPGSLIAQSDTSRIVTTDSISLVGVLPIYSDRGIGTDYLPLISDSVIVDKLPASINGKYVGITYDQMDYLTVLKFEHEEAVEQRIIYQTAYTEALDTLARRDATIIAFKQASDVQAGDINILKMNEKRLLYNMDILQGQVKKERGNTVKAWITCGVITGILTAALIGK